MSRNYDEVMALFDAIARAWYATCLPTDTCHATTPSVPREVVEILTTPKIAVLTLQRLDRFLAQRREEMRQHATRYLDGQQRKPRGAAMLSLQESQATARLLDHQVRLLLLPATVQETVAQVTQHVTGIWAQLTPREQDELISLLRWHEDQCCDVCHCHRCRTPTETCRKCQIYEEDL